MLSKRRLAALSISKVEERSYTTLQEMLDFEDLHSIFPFKASKPSLLELSKQLSSYNSGDLLSKVASLQLCPENASRIVRLEALAHVVASLAPQPDRPTITASRLRQICASSTLTDLSYAEDPSENPFAEEIIFFGGSYSILPGIASNAEYILSHLSKAIFLKRNRTLPDDFSNRVYKLMRGSLAISNHVLGSAGIRRGTPPVSNLGEPIEVPGTARLSRLQKAATLSKKELSGVLRSHNLDTSSIAPLIRQLGSVDISTYKIDNGDLLWAPLVDCGDEVVLALPGMVVSAVRNVILRWAGEAKILKELGELFNQAIWNTVNQNLGYLDNHPLSLDVPPWHNAPLSSEGLFVFDSDKLLYCVLATDPLTGFDASQPFKMWTDDDLEEHINNRVKEVEKFLLSMNTPPNDILVLGLLQGAGGAGGIALEKTPYNSEALLMSANDLQTITLLEGGNPLFLFDFARDKHKAHKRMHITSTSILDEFELYRANGCSYYISDRKRPDFVVIPPGDGLQARMEVVHQRDFHAAKFGNAVVEVTNLHSNPSIPLYVPVSDLGQKIRILVEGFSSPLWVVASDGAETEAHSIYAKIVDAIAFWLWQLQPTLKPALDDLGFREKIITITIELADASKWKSKMSQVSPESNPAIATHLNSRSALNVIIRHTLIPMLATADNQGEREMMRAILAGLNTLNESRGQSPLDSIAIQKMLDRFAPFGQKKMILLNDVSVIPQLDPRDLPRYRKLQDSKINVVLDEIGAYLISQKHLPVGPIAESSWTQVLNDVAFYCFRAIEKEIATLEADHIQEFFIMQSEAVVRETALDRLTLPTRIQCFGAVESIRQQIEKKIPELAHAALASRFLVEYVAARPPRGLRPISVDFYDRLRSLAHHMINFAMLSDAIHFKLQEYTVSLLPSQRLGVAGEPWKDAMRNYMRASAEEKIATAPDNFRHYWEKSESSEDRQELWTELDSATQQEFCHSLTDIFSFFGLLAELGSKQKNHAVASMPRTSLIQSVSERTQWNLKKIEHLLELLTITPRASFWDVPAGFVKQDLYPWRYNRSLSYLRRPLIAGSSTSDTDILWGNRHLREARQYLLDQLTSGRLKPITQGLRSLNSRLRHEEGEAFNTVVANLFAGFPSVLVKARVKKIKGLKELQRHLGDIDVLVADQQRKRILLIECKNFSTARTPYEMFQEVKEMFMDKEDRKSIVKKHLARAKWVKSNLEHILTFLGFPTAAHWKVIPIIVVDQVLVAPFLRKSPVPVFTAEDIRRKWPKIG